MQINLKAPVAIFFLFGALSLLLPQCSFAFSWQDLWLTKNQQAAKLYSKGELKKAATQFSNSLWKGVADYHSGQYKQAIQDFSKENTPLANYNRGNALVHTGNYQQAIAAYDQALKKNPNFKDALYNKKLLEKLLQQPPKKSKQSSNKHPDQHEKQGQHGKNNQQKQKQKESNQQQKNSAHASNSSQSHPNQTNQANQNSQTESTSPQQKKNQAQTQQQSPEQQQQAQQSQRKNQQEKQQQQQALKQWLQQIPDDPGGLLREKFLRDHWRLQMPLQDEG